MEDNEIAELINGEMSSNSQISMDPWISFLERFAPVCAKGCLNPGLEEIALRSEKLLAEGSGSTPTSALSLFKAASFLLGHVQSVIKLCR